MLSMYMRFGFLILSGVFIMSSAIAVSTHDSAWAVDVEPTCQAEIRVICLTRTSSWHKEGGKVTTKAWIEGQEERDDYTFLLNENNELKIISADGEIIILSGRVMLARDVPLEKGYEIDWADAPMNNYLMATGLLNLAFPSGPSGIISEHEIVVSEDKKALRVSTGSAFFEYRAPWQASVRAVRVNDDSISYKIVMKMIMRNAELNLSGVWENLSSRLVLENSMDISDWETFAIGVFTRLPGRLDGSKPARGGKSVIVDYGAYPHDFDVDTIGGLRAHIKQNDGNLSGTNTQTSDTDAQAEDEETSTDPVSGFFKRLFKGGDSQESEINTQESDADTEESDADTQEKTIDMDGYTVDHPPGDDWETVITAEEQKVKFSKVATDSDDNVLSIKEIMIRPQWAKDRNMWKLSEQEIAKKYFEKERLGMKLYALIRKSTMDEEKEKIVYVDNRKLYNAYSKQTTPKGDLTMITEQSMYLYFPPGYKEDDKFIIFLVSEGYLPERSELTDLSVILPVIKSLQIDPEKLNE